MMKILTRIESLKMTQLEKLLEETLSSHWKLTMYWWIDLGPDLEMWGFGPIFLSGYYFTMVCIDTSEFNVLLLTAKYVICYSKIWDLMILFVNVTTIIIL